MICCLKVLRVLYDFPQSGHTNGSEEDRFLMCWVFSSEGEDLEDSWLTEDCLGADHFRVDNNLEEKLGFACEIKITASEDCFFYAF